MTRILIGGPIRQEPHILVEHLESLMHLDTRGLQVDFVFIDDNDQAASSAILQHFALPGSQTTLVKGNNTLTYHRSEHSHTWTTGLLAKMVDYRNFMIRQTIAGGYDHLFMIDSDLVLHPLTLQQLVKARVDIISEIFWTRWAPDQGEMPQVWLSDAYEFTPPEYAQHPLEVRTEMGHQFLEQLRRPGVYQVGGLGACTLFSRRALEGGCHYGMIGNLSLQGEDRHFCVRAAALGFRMHVDTHFPAFHIYRESDLERLPAYKASRPRCTAEATAVLALQESLARWGTTHYVTMTGREGLDGFAPAARAAFEARAEQMVATARESRSVSRLEVSWSLPLAQPDGSVVVQGIARQEGREGDQAFQDLLDVSAVMVPAEARWLIGDVQFTPRTEPAPQAPFIRKTRGNRVLLSMVVRNEADNYLERMLAHAARYVDEVQVLDDGSTDETVAVCRRVLEASGTPYSIVELGQSLFHQEHRLRRLQWELALSRRPDWILVLDADQIFEDRMATQIRSLVDQDHADLVTFRLYDFWDERHFREDGLWCAHTGHKAHLVRPVPGISHAWVETDQHCGHFPTGINDLAVIHSDIRLKHYGWARPEERQRKFERYMALDPQGRFGSMAQYQSILDPSPNLVPWVEA